MTSRYIAEDVRRRLYAESMGRCMNPSCRAELFVASGDIAEKAHIDPYCASADNSFENLVLLCPNCHTAFDKNHAFTPDEVLSWKKIRQDEIEQFFGGKCDSFDELKSRVVPLLLENQEIYKKYFLCGRRDLWDSFECVILSNNRKLKTLFSGNFHLLQSNDNPEYSNQSAVIRFIRHADEFELTRQSGSRIRSFIFPPEINSMFGIEPIDDKVIPSTESLEALFVELIDRNLLVDVNLDSSRPSFTIEDGDETSKIYLSDSPRLRQLYHQYDCFRGIGVRLDSLLFAYGYIRKQGVDFIIPNLGCLSKILVQEVLVIFVYKYCFSRADLLVLNPDEGSVVVNLHNWNGMLCITSEATELADDMDVTLLTMDGFYDFIRGFKRNRRLSN